MSTFHSALLGWLPKEEEASPALYPHQGEALDCPILLVSWHENSHLYKQRHPQLRDPSTPGLTAALWVAKEAEGCQEAKEGPRWFGIGCTLTRTVDSH